jgi:hypothetical protein
MTRRRPSIACPPERCAHAAPWRSATITPDGRLRCGVCPLCKIRVVEHLAAREGSSSNPQETRHANTH